ncbi:enhanced level of genomic instability 1 isoform X2 [Eurosta solidaginis]
MEEVLNSVKKKHRQKHKKKREQKKLAQMEAVAVAVATAELEKAEALDEEQTSNLQLNESPTLHVSKCRDATKTHGKRLKTQPLQEKYVQENGQEGCSRNGRKSKSLESKSALNNATANGDILRHFQMTPKKNAELEENEKNNADIKGAPVYNKISCTETLATTNSTKPMNAFEVMMNARNKTIGSNTPGKETSPTTGQESTINIKRKLMLQEWADKKGASKRKLDEETRAAFVENQLENRAKRFKQMLVHPASPKQDDTPISRTTSERKRDKKKANATNSIKQNVEKPKRKKRTMLRLESVDSNNDVDEIVKIDPETEAFLAKLNSPIKKRDSLFGYFPRKDSSTENALLAKNEDHIEIETPKTFKAIAEKCKDQIKSVKSKAEIDTNKNTKALSAKSNVSNCTETPKMRLPRRSTKTNIEETPATTDSLTKQNVGEKTHEEVTHQEALEADQTPSGRPKRSCAGKARYDYDLEVSPTKLENTNRVGNKTTRMRETAYVEEIIQLDDSNMSSPEKVPKKLAPVFVRAMPKPSPDPVALKARQDFLMSGVPEKMRLEMEKQKQYEQTYDEELDYFPRVCHIQQFDVDEKVFLQSKQDFNTKLKPCEYDFSFNHSIDSKILKNTKGSRRKSRNNSTSCIPKMKTNENVNQCINSKTQWLSIHQLPTIENKRTIIKSWKTEFDRFPTFKCYNQMREKYRFFSALDAAQDMEQVSESLVVTRRTQRTRNNAEINATTEQDDVKPPATAPNGELLFTEKYKPMLVDQVLVNLVPVTQLRDFLAVWANGSNTSSARNSQTMDDSFDASNDSNSSLCNVTGNSVVLLGPVSSGKTNAVYALANDMNFNVLEINAGMKRTGKRLIQELQEATQSHQIRKDSTPIQSTSKAQKNLLRMSLNGKMLKKQNSQSYLDADTSSNSNADASQNTRKCLILIEDADVVFDQLDCGFTDAIYTLAASSKRPVIVMATNPNCPHLQRLMNQNTIYFTPPNALNISRFMAVLSLIENCPINLDDLVSLYLFNGKDLRRTLLELQFFIQSGGDRHKLRIEKNCTKEPRQRTPQKSDCSAKRELGYFASPAKCSTTLEQNNIQQPQEPDEQLGAECININDNDGIKSTNFNVYVHGSLFEFFTGNQNEKWRIPFPVDFGLLRVNLADIFECSQRLHNVELVQATNQDYVKLNDNGSTGVKKSTPKRKTRTHKKTWLNNSASTDNVEQQAAAKSPLDVLCDFYDNISIAALLGTHNADMSEGNSNTFSASGILGGGADLGIDRLLPNLSESVAHEIVEQAISVNLASKVCPYNLFNTPVERPTLCDYMNSSNIMSSRSQRKRALDVEPALRAICRSEKQRAMQERRSTRFYHYLRHSAAITSNFSMEAFDEACSVLQEKNDSTDEESEDGKSKHKDIY